MIRTSTYRSALLTVLLGVLAAALSLSAAAQEQTIVLGQENAATFTKSDLQTTKKLLTEAYEAGQLSSLIYYGNWYGPGLSGGEYNTGKAGNSQPIDALDAIAMRHDFAYDVAAEMGKKYGPQEEARLKAIADSIAVQEANALPRNPLEWDPPAPDPDKASDYRKRIGFGFAYTSKASGAAAGAMTTLQTIRNSINGDPTPIPASSGIDEAELKRLSAARAQEWFQGRDVRPIFRIELSAPTDLIEEMMKSVEIQVAVVPISNEGAQWSDVESRDAIKELAESIRHDISYALDGGGFCDLEYTPTGDLRLTTRNWTGGTTSIRVSASYDGPAADVEGASLWFDVALPSEVELRVEPEIVQFAFSNDPGPPERFVHITARAKDAATGHGIPGMLLNFASDSGFTCLLTTDEGGYAELKLKFVPEDLAPEFMAEIPIIVSTASRTVGETHYMPSSKTVSVTLRRWETSWIRGRVVDKGRNDRPIEGASIALRSPSGQPYNATTGSDGSFEVHVIEEEGLPQLSGTVTAAGYEPASFTATTAGERYVIGLYAPEATLIGHIVNEETGKGIDGSTVHITAPFDQLLTTSGGDFTVTGLYVGDTVTMRADAQNFRAYIKSGKITMANPVVTFALSPGSGEESNVLDEKEAGEEEKEEVANLNTLYSLMVWATPADPATFQDVTITAQIFPPRQGVTIEIQMHGTDDYASSITASTNAMGKAFLSIPGAASGVVDDVVAWIVGTNVKQRLRYSF